MQNHDQQTVNYIWEHLHKGFTEADIRAHMLQGGWTEETIQRAFQNYYAAAGVPIPAPQPIPLATAPPPKRHFNKWMLIIPLAALFLAAAIFVALSVISSKKDVLDEVTTPTTSSSSRSALERNARNATRKSDAISILTAISEYQNNNAGSLPEVYVVNNDTQTLDLCNADCEPSSISSVKLSIYDPDNVQSQPYTYDVKVSDTTTLYILNDASCNDAGSKATSSSSRSMAILFGLEGTSNTTKQTCITV